MDHKSIIHFIFQHMIDNPEKIAVRYPVNGAYCDMTYGEFGDRVASVAAWLAGQGVRAGDRVAILAENSVNWVIADMAISFCRCISVSIYPTLTPKDVQYIIENSDSTILFLQNREQMNKVMLVRDGLPQLKTIVSFEEPDAPGPVPALLLDDIMKGYPARTRDMGKAVSAIDTDDPICIIYTSGTTGPPKGVVLTHGNILFVLDSILSLIPDPDVITTNLSFLPLSHALERIAGYYMTFYLGRTIAFAESLNTIVNDMKTIRPSHAIAVPRVFEKIFERIVSGVSEHGGLKLKIFWWSFRAGAEASRCKSAGKRMGPLLALRYAVAYRLVYAKLYEAVGGNLKYFISGGAPLAKRIAEFFDAAGILILEGWGATETSAPATWNTPVDYRFGSVGRPIPGVEVKADSEGELYIRGPSVFREYWKMPDATRDAKDPDGWYHTGDIGIIDKEGYVYITDRKKELIITAAGKNISPANIENLIKSSPYVSNVLAFGDRQKYITALVTLEQNEVASYLRKMNVDITDQRMLHHMPEVSRLIGDEIKRLNRDLARFEQIKEFRIVEKDFSIEDDLLTPTLKLKRKNIIARYKGLIESMHHDDIAKALEG